MKPAFLPEQPTPAAYLKAARQIHAALPAGLQPVRLAVLSTFTAQMLDPYLVVEGAERGLLLQNWFGPWGQLEQQALDARSELYQSAPTAILVFVRLEEMMPDFARSYFQWRAQEREGSLAALRSRLGELLTALRARSQATLLVANFAPLRHSASGLASAMLSHAEDRFVQECNDVVAELCARTPGAYVFDYHRLVVETGFGALFDAKLQYMARMPFGVPGQIAVARRLARTLRAAFLPSAKVLVLDLDNTLWGGVLGEDGLGGIALGDEYPGLVYKEFQRYLLTLKDRGVLLAIATKNNPADVEEVWARHAEMVLRREDFAAIRVNWREKSANLAEIAAELNVGIDSLVFFDDSAFEREEVRQSAPDVKVVDAPATPIGYIDAVEQSGFFDRLVLSAEDLQRSALYQEQQKRAEAQASAGTAEEFLQSLQLKATIGEVGPDTLPRVAQLLAKTNQFNLTTRRHTAAELGKMTEEGGVVLWLRLADRFGDNGLVGVAVALPADANAWRVDTFLLSCRVIGRGAETALLAELAARAVARGAQQLRGEFIPSAKNAIAAEFYERHGFQPAGEGLWEIALDPGVLQTPPFISVRSV